MSVLLKNVLALNCSYTINKLLTPAVVTSSSLLERLADIWDGVLNAVPKKRRSLQQRHWRNKFKALQPRNDIEDCVVCGHKKLQGHLCNNCFKWTMTLTEKLWQKKIDSGEINTKRHVR